MLRKQFLSSIIKHFKTHKVAEAYNISKINIFDLENPLDLARLNEPMLALSDSYFKSSC